MTYPVHFTFDYDYQQECWNLSRGSVPPQLKAQGVPHALWMHFWDYAQSVVERATVRNIMTKKLKSECKKDASISSKNKQHKQERQNEMSKLREQTAKDFDCLQEQAERLFPNARAKVSTDVHKGRPFGLEIELMHSPYTSDTVQLLYDQRRAAWNFSRDNMPTELSNSGVPISDWSAIWDYAYGVNERAKERESLNELHERELVLCQKSLSYMNTTKVDTVDQNAASDHNTTASHIRMKMEKLQKAKEANANNTKKGWQELQRRANQRFGPHGIKVTLCSPDGHRSRGIQFKCPTTESRRQSQKSSLNACSVWLPITSSTGTSTSRHSMPPSSSIWLTSSLSPKRDPPPSPSSTSTSASTISPSSLSSYRAVLSNKSNTEWKENAPPKPEKPRSRNSPTKECTSVWPNPVVLTYVHEDGDHSSSKDYSDNVEITSFPSDLDIDMDHLVIPPAPTDPPSSIGSSSSTSTSSISEYHKNVVTPPPPPPPPPPAAAKPIRKQLRFGRNQEHVYDNPYITMDRKTLWFSAEDREASRNKTKLLAQRVTDNRKSGGRSDNVIFMDSETNSEVCWRGLEHAKRGNLHYRQEIRRAYLSKVLEKQRAVRMAMMTSRRGTVVDPEAELQHYAARQSRTCRERAQKLAAQDAREARTVYKESLRGANNQHQHGSGKSISSSGSGINHNRSFGSRTGSLFSPQYQNSSKLHQHHHQTDIFQEYCRTMHLASKTRSQQPTAITA